ncbi:hypothetical protein OAK75_00075 [Bacteriovoracales bacterium]|nr:hypothetical protein [Bacteriovoracales bacterium]
MSKKLRGYVSSTFINGNIIPQRVQNLVIRNYASLNNLEYFLSTAEYYMKECFMQLNGEIKNLSKLDGMVFYSVHQLPNSLTLAKELIISILDQGKELHFALEEKKICSKEDLAYIENFILAKSLCLKKLPMDVAKHMTSSIVWE